MDEPQIQTVKRPIAQRLGFRRIIKNRRQEKLRSKQYKSPKKENTPPLRGSTSDKSSPKKKTLVLKEPKEAEQTKVKETIITINESSDTLGKRKRKTEK